MGYHKIRFEKDSEKAIRNESLQKALVNVTDRFRSQRNKASSEVPNWEELRNKARQKKKETIANLDKYLLQLEESVVNAGGKVHWAKDSNVACQIILNIAKEGQVKSVVKSKSMATEEIELNDSFESSGIKVVETDLGEYIIQLAGEHPSHIIAPAIHKTKDDISKLFSEKLEIPYYEKPEELTKVARERLRSEFLNADMGVSGANFAVAETGTIVVVENEGNARLTTTVPRIHLALVGIEKLILIPRQPTHHRPEEFHLILLDNGRSKILASEETRESLYCIRCGACLNNCPVYRHVGGHSYGWAYSGPIGAIITPQLLGIDKAPELPFASSLCGACHDVCPVKIDFPKVLLELRKNVVKSKEKSSRAGAALLEKLGIKLWRFTVEHEYLYKLLNKISYYLQIPWKQSNGKLRSLPYPFSRWTDERDFPSVARKTFRERWKEIR